MHAEEATRLHGGLSTTRMSEYLLRCGGDHVAALRLHCWNTEISEALYGPLQYLELATRSSMTARLCSHFGRNDWWDDPRANLNRVAQDKVSGVKDQAARGAAFRPLTITESLSFGFWVSLLGRGNDYEKHLWRPALHRAFPHWGGNRSGLHKKLDYLRVLRNKIAHHAPIHHRHLLADHLGIIECLGYIDPGLARMVGRHSRFPEVLARRP
ncbi:Abi family protein [Herbidospora cretacea]|uniref:Abi family protein n=1 Tax=Herbidospora cretacea TaxID=28444 RepID=UPI00077361CF|nr:Abi family protein [Herbidospora cretacea]